MRPVKTAESTNVLRLAGGNEDNDLWCERLEGGDGTPITWSVWVPTAEERQAIAAGRNIGLAVYGGGHPPVSLGLTGEQPVSPRRGERSRGGKGVVVTGRLKTEDGELLSEQVSPAADLLVVSSIAQAFSLAGRKLQFEVAFDPPLRT